MHCHIQRFDEPGGILRGWVDPSHGYGDPYQISATVRWLDPVSVEVMGLVAEMDLEIGHAIKAACRDLGIERIRSHRIKHDRQFRSWLRVARPNIFNTSFVP